MSGYDIYDLDLFALLSKQTPEKYVEKVKITQHKI